MLITKLKETAPECQLPDYHPRSNTLPWFKFNHIFRISSRAGVLISVKDKSKVTLVPERILDTEEAQQESKF